MKFLTETDLRQSTQAELVEKPVIDNQSVDPNRLRVASFLWHRKNTFSTDAEINSDFQEIVRFTTIKSTHVHDMSQNQAQEHEIPVGFWVCSCSGCL
jgi:hypothetical protein